MKDSENDQLQEIKALLDSFFPDSRLDDEHIQTLTTQNDEQILFGPEKILPYLQTVFFEEHLAEIQIDHSTRLFFAHLLDDLPSLLEEHDDNGEVVFLEPDYESGSYLKKLETFILTPLTPGIGNARVRSSKQVVLRYFSGTVSIELGCSFQKQDVVREIPVLRFNYPVIGRVTRNYRHYRVKTIATVEAHVCVQNPDSSGGTEICHQIVDISAMGVAFQTQSEDSPYEIGDSLKCTVRVKGIGELTVCGSVRRVAKVRQKQSYTNICGIRFDLETRALATEIEQLAAAIQRLHIREMSNRISDFRGVRLVR